MTRGSCLCGAVRYELRGQLREVVACHCTQCRKSSGHYLAATQVEARNATIHGEPLKWYRSSEEAERGFCSVCGSNLFWRRICDSRISIFAGTIDGPTGLTMAKQLYAEDAGDYYDIPDLPTIPQTNLK